MCGVFFIVDVLLIHFGTLSESEKVTKFCSESIFSMISGVPPIASASAVKVDAILAILNFHLIPSLISIAANPTYRLWRWAGVFFFHFEKKKSRECKTRQCSSGPLLEFRDSYRCCHLAAERCLWLFARSAMQQWKDDSNERCIKDDQRAQPCIVSGDFPLLSRSSTFLKIFILF
jgi:hypothetical protein